MHSEVHGVRVRVRVRVGRRHRHVPKKIVNTKKRARIVEDSQRRKEDNVRRHSKPGAAVGSEPERKRHIVAEAE